MQDFQESRSWSWFASGYAYLLLLVVWACFFIPLLGGPEFRKEEGRRAQVAREMLETDNWVVPTFHGKPYLAKPPFFYWAVMAFSSNPEKVNEWSARLPSALSLLVCAMVVGWTSQEFWGGNPLLSGLMVFSTPLLWEKADLAEIESLLAVLSILFLVAFWKSAEPGASNGWAVLGGLALSLAILTKGPVALLFFYMNAMVLLIWNRRVRWFLSIDHILFLFLGLLGPLAWMVLLSRQIPLEVAMAEWTHEVGAARSFQGWSETLTSLTVYPLTAFLGLLPGSLGLIFLTAKKHRTVIEEDLFRRAVAALVPLFLFFWVHGRHGRYVIPAAPVAALLAGVLCTPLFVRILWSRRVVSGAFALFLILGLVNICGRWQISKVGENRKFGEKLTELVPASEVLYSRLGESYRNQSFYIRRKILQVDDWTELPTGLSTVWLHADEIPPVTPWMRQKLYEGSSGSLEPVAVIKIEKMPFSPPATGTPGKAEKYLP